jgi:hypothetical protein
MVADSKNMGIVSALVTFALFMGADACVLVTHFKWPCPTTDFGFTATARDAMAFVVVLVFGVVFSLVLLPDPAFP